MADADASKFARRDVLKQIATVAGTAQLAPALMATVAASAEARNSQESSLRSTEITMPSGQSACTFSSARAIAMSSASLLTGLLMTAVSPAR